MIEAGEKYLITTDHWFYAPDGKKYRAVWGTARIESDEELGIKTNRNSTNWYVVVGMDKPFVIAGCQVHYAMRCDEKPNVKQVTDQMYGESTYKQFKRFTEIYIVDET
jgi:hypothetical protein